MAHRSGACTGYFNVLSLCIICVPCLPYLLLIWAISFLLKSLSPKAVLSIVPVVLGAFSASTVSPAVRSPPPIHSSCLRPV